MLIVVPRVELFSFGFKVRKEKFLRFSDINKRISSKIQP